MKLQRLQLSNFRQYIDLDLTFDDGITAIIGANGSGKSTLLEAICWALYGTEALRSKVEEVRPLFLSSLESTSQRSRGTVPKVVLNFSLGDMVYELERTPQGARLYRLNGERVAIADGTTAVNDMVQKILGGMTYRQFLTSFFAQQGELEFLHFDKARRRNEVLRMLGLERVSRSAKWMDDQLTTERAELRGKQSLPLSPEEAQAQLKSAQEELNQALTELAEAEKALTAARAEWERWTPLAQEWEAKKTAHDSLQTQTQLLQQTISARQQELSRLTRDVQEATAAKARLEELRPKGERYKQVRDQLQAMEDLQRYEQRRAELRARIEALEAQVAERQQKLAHATAHLAELQEHKKALDEEEKRVVALVQKVSELDDLRRQLETMDRLKSDVQQKLAALDAQITSMRGRLDDLKRQVEASEHIVQDLERTQQLVQEAEQRVHDLEAEFARLERLRGSVIAQAEAEANSVRRQMSEIEEKRQKVEALGPDGACPVCTRPLGEDFPSVVKHFDSELEVAERRLQAALSRKAEAERDTEAIEQCRTSLQEARSDLQQYRERVAQLREQANQRERWSLEAQQLDKQIGALARQREDLAASYDAQAHEALHQSVNELLPEAQRAQTEQQVLREKIAQWRREADRVREEGRQARAGLEDAQSQRRQAQLELSQLPTGYDATLHQRLRQELAELQPVWDEALQLRPVADRLSDLQTQYEGVEAALKQAEQQMESTQQKLIELAYDAGEYQRVIEQYAQCEGKVRQAETQVSVLQERVTQRSAQVQALEEQWQRLQEHLRELRELQRAVQRDEIVRNWLRSFGDLLNGEVVPELQERAGELLNLLTDGRYTQIHISEDFEFTLLDEERPKPIISGGEEDIVNLSLRLAMAEMICERTGQPLGLLVLDEVFGSLDADRRENALQLLRRLRDRFDQIIIISHIEEIQAGADRCLWVDYDPKQHRSSVREEATFLLSAEMLEAEVLKPEEPALHVARLGGLFES